MKHRLSAGDLNRRIRIERRSGGQDASGQPLDEWELVGSVWANIANQTGISAIRSRLENGIVAEIARYSFMVRAASVRALRINGAMRIVYAGLVFDIEGITRDLDCADRAFILCQQVSELPVPVGPALTYLVTQIGDNIATESGDRLHTGQQWQT